MTSPDCPRYDRASCTFPRTQARVTPVSRNTAGTVPAAPGACLCRRRRGAARRRTCACGRLWPTPLAREAVQTRVVYVGRWRWEPSKET